jgi:hypothetical protein
MDAVALISVSYILGVSGLILMGIGTAIVILALLLEGIHRPWPRFLLRPDRVGTFSMLLIFFGLGLLALDFIVTAAKSLL